MLADSTFQLFCPSVQVVETIIEDDPITVFRYFGAPIFYNIEVVRMFWIKRPLFPIRGLNLSIPNPSNFSIYDGSKYLPWEMKPFAIDVEADSSLGFSLLADSAGNVTSISVMPLKESQVKPRSFIKLTYNDVLSLQSIKITEPNEMDLGNGSISVSMSLIINNTDSRRLHSSLFALFSVQHYGNMTSFTFLENGTIRPSQWKIVQEQWLWTSFYVSSRSFVNFTVSTVFEETPH